MKVRMRRTALTLIAGLAVSALSLGVTDGTLTGAGASMPNDLVVEPYSGVACGSVQVGATSGQCGNASDAEFDGFALINSSGATITINLSSGVSYAGAGAGDYTLDAHFCDGYSTGTVTMIAGYQCRMEVLFHPSAVGDRSATMTITASDSSSTVVSLSGTGSPTGSLSFPDTTLGTFTSAPYVLTNSGASTETIDLSSNDLSFTGPGADDYLVTPSGDCPGDGVSTVVLTAGSACTLNVDFYPGALGNRSATMIIRGHSGLLVWVDLSGNGTIGYYQVDEFGDVANYGDAAWYGDTGNDNLNSPIVGIAATGDNGGYWLVSSDGGIFTFGPSAQFFGSAGAIHLNKPIVGMAATPDARGYWLVASDGGIFSYGDAQFFGSTGAIHLNQPIVGMASTPDGAGYWLVASDGGIFAYGDAQFFGSTGAIHLNKPIVGMESAPRGNGYWLVASDGGVFAFGPGAPFYGSAGSLPLVEPITSMAAMPDGSGYWFSAADGGLFSYNAPFYGSGTNDPNLDVIVDMASDGSAPLQTLIDTPAIRARLAAGVSGSDAPRYAGPSSR
jgi:hypothetical protein